MNAPTSFGLAFFLRVAFPGLFAVFLAIPILSTGLTIDFSATGLATLGALAGVAGLTLFLLDTLIYDIFEGRVFWPSKLRDRKTPKWEAWLDVQWSKIKELEALRRQLEQASKQNKAELLVLERNLGLLYDRVMDFPFSEDRRPHAIWPTRFGNVMASYEYYSETRYGMDAAFYWYRLWLLVPDDTRKEYDSYWAVGQTWLYASAVSLVAFLVYGALTTWTALEWGLSLLSVTIKPGRLYQVVSFLEQPRASRRIVSFVGAGPNAWDWRILLFLLAFTVFTIVLWKICYRLAIVQHRVSGEFFKSLFDVYRDELEVQRFKATAGGDWEDAASFLQYFEGGSVLGRRKARQKEESLSGFGHARFSKLI